MMAIITVPDNPNSGPRVTYTEPPADPAPAQLATAEVFILLLLLGAAVGAVLLLQKLWLARSKIADKSLDLAAQGEGMRRRLADRLAETRKTIRDRADKLDR